MKTNKIFMVLLLTLLGTILLAGIANAKQQCAAAPTLTTPASSTMYSGDLWINVSNLNRSCDMKNCSVYCSSSQTANSSASLVGTATNKTVAANQANVSIWTGILEDSNDYTCYAVCSNHSTYGTNTATSASASKTSVCIDNTVPSRPTTPLPATGTVLELQDFYINATINNSGATDCYIYWGTAGGSKQTVVGTYSASTCKTLLTGIGDGNYEWTVKAYDNTNMSSPMVEATFEIDTGRSTGSMLNLLQNIQQTGEAKITTGTPGTSSKTIVIGILAILGVWYFFIRKH